MPLATKHTALAAPAPARPPRRGGAGALRAREAHGRGRAGARPSGSGHHRSGSGSFPTKPVRASAAMRDRVTRLSPSVLRSSL